MKKFKTIRGLITGEEPVDEMYFHFDITLRIFGDNLPLMEISRELGIQPTSSRRKGDRRKPNSVPYKDDAWHFKPQLDNTEPLEIHIAELWKFLKPHVEYIKSLKEKYNVDIFCGYISNCDHAGFEVSHKSLEMFSALEVPFGVSVVVGDDCFFGNNPYKKY